MKLQIYEFMYLRLNFLMFQDRIGSLSSSSSMVPSRSPPVTSSLSEFQPPYFPPPLTQLTQEQQQMFSSLPVSLASLQPTPCLPSLVTLPPASSDSFQSNSTSLQSFSSNSQANRRLTQDSPSPLSLVKV